MPYPLVDNLVNRDKSKFVVVMRNPKDVLVSMYHFYRTNRGFGLYTGTWDQVWAEFIEIEENVCVCPVEYCTTWWADNQNKDNVLIMFYEDMKKDLSAAVTMVAAYLEKDLTEEQHKKIVDAVSFKSMKENPSVNYEDCGALDPSRGKFIRKGIVGDWKNYFSEEQDKFYDEGPMKLLEGTGLEFDYGE